MLLGWLRLQPAARLRSIVGEHASTRTTSSGVRYHKGTWSEDIIGDGRLSLRAGKFFRKSSLWFCRAPGSSIHVNFAVVIAPLPGSSSNHFVGGRPLF